MATVVRIRRANGVVVQDCDVYIGGMVHQGGWHLRASRWDNPFKVGQLTREQAVQQYEAYIRASPHLIASLPELADKRLGCWCYPEICHGDVLIKLLNEYYPPPPDENLRKLFSSLRL